MGNRELLYMKLALEEWRHWLEGATQPFTLGTRHIKADALSCQTEEIVQAPANNNIIPENMLMAPVQLDIITEIGQSNLQEPPPSECPTDLLYVPEPLHPRLLDQVHSTPISGHPGITATTHLHRNRFWWLTDTTEHIQNCTNCNTSKSLRQLPAVEEHICNHVFHFYGLPEDILSDRGPQITSRVWAAFFKHLNINIRLTSGYQPPIQ